MGILYANDQLLRIWLILLLHKKITFVVMKPWADGRMYIMRLPKTYFFSHKNIGLANSSSHFLKNSTPPAQP